MGWGVGTAADTGQQLRLFSQIQLSLSFSHGASFHIPVRSIIAQSSRPIESLGSPVFQWLQGFVGVFLALRVGLACSPEDLPCLLLGSNLDTLRV